MKLTDLAALGDELNNLLAAYQDARTKATDKEWDALSEGPLEDVLNSLAELEDLVS